MYSRIFLLLAVVTAFSCTKPPLFPPGQEGLVEHLEVNQVLSYGNPVMLHVAGKASAAIVLDTDLIENDDVPHLIFTARAASQSGNKVMLSNQVFNPYGRSWASALNEGFTIYGQATGQKKWSDPQEHGLLLAVAGDGNTTEYKGAWKEKQLRYLAISLQMEDGIHYGWVGISHEAGKSELKIHDWAYAKMAQKIVRAGKH